MQHKRRPICVHAALHALLADSDIDLGLFGVMHSVALESITQAQAKKLLYSVLGSLHRAHLVNGKASEGVGSDGVMPLVLLLQVAPSTYTGHLRHLLPCTDLAFNKCNRTS